MLRILLLASFAVASVPAQGQMPRPLATGERVALAAGGLAMGGTLGVAAGALAPGDETAEALAFIVTYPLGVALGVAGASYALDLDASLGGPLRGALLGAAVGLPLAAVILYVNYIEVSASGEILDGSVLSAVAVGAFVALPVAFAVARVEAAPAALAAPTGERAAGLSLTLGL